MTSTLDYVSSLCLSRPGVLKLSAITLTLDMVIELMPMRLQKSMGDLFHNRLVTARTDIPRRTDIDAPVPYRQNKHVLFGQQEGRCSGCWSEFPFRILEVDHVIPRRVGDQDNIENPQLLCAHCNWVKGDRPQEYLVARLRELGIAA